jgi:hypothetical protein
MPGIPENYKAKQGQIEFYQGNGGSSSAKPKPKAKKKTKGKPAPVARKNNSTRTSFMDDMWKGTRGQ